MLAAALLGLLPAGNPVAAGVLSVVLAILAIAWLLCGWVTLVRVRDYQRLKETAMRSARNTDAFSTAGVDNAYPTRGAAIPDISGAIATASGHVAILGWDLSGIRQAPTFKEALSEFLSRPGVRLDIYFYRPSAADAQERALRDHRGTDVDREYATQSTMSRVETSQAAFLDWIDALRSRRGEVNVKTVPWKPIRSIYLIDPDNEDQGTAFLWSYHDGNSSPTACVRLRPLAGAPGSLFTVVRTILADAEDAAEPYFPDGPRLTAGRRHGR